MDWQSWEWGKIATGLGIAGVLAGVSKSLTDHWLAQRKDRTAYRRAKLEEWRLAIRETSWPALGDTPAYADLRRYLRAEIVRSIEHPRTYFVPGGRGNHPVKQRLLDEVARIEREWGLI